jgi:hypothetical protein
VKQFIVERRGPGYHDANPLRDASVALLDQASQKDHGTRWPGIMAILAIQLAVLFALAGAAIVYLNWSSNAALAEFMATSKPLASEPSHAPQLLTPVQHAKDRTSCARRG